MREFAMLFERLDQTTATEGKLVALRAYWREADPADAAWAVYFLAGGKPRRVVSTRELRALACELAALPDWLFEACYAAVGDLAETIALILPDDGGGDAAMRKQGLAWWVEERILPLAELETQARQRLLRESLLVLTARERFLFVKLIGGGFRVGVSRGHIERSLAEVAGVSRQRMAERLMGYTDRERRPNAEDFQALMQAETVVSPGADAGGQPYPFFLAHPLPEGEADLDALLGDPSQWQVEWKYDGIRAQLVCRAGRVWLWSRGEELISERFPEIIAAAEVLPVGTVLDGEIVIWRDEAPASFAELQTRIGRKLVSKKLLRERPARFLAYDLLESDREDRRQLPLAQRRARLEALFDRLQGLAPSLMLAPRLCAPSWPAYAALRAEARRQGVEGLMLKALDSRYGSGRTKREGIWWKWKLEPYTIDAILVMAQAGHGRRANLYTDYTFAVWSRSPASREEAEAAIERVVQRQAPSDHELRLVNIAKAYSGLSDTEIRAVDALIRRSTIERFGPVRAVRPSLVFELAFEGIAVSSRHKAGLAVRFPRILRIRHDKPLAEAACLAELQALLPDRDQAAPTSSST